jgi:transposase
MRPADGRQASLFAMTPIEARIPRQHPLRTVRTVAAEVGAGLRPRIDRCYPAAGRGQIAPEEVLRALLLWGLYGHASERRLIEELDYNLLYRWFIGLGIDDPLWSRETFREHRHRLDQGGVVSAFIAGCMTRLTTRILANPHFAPNRALLEAWSGQLRWDEPGRG